MPSLRAGAPLVLFATIATLSLLAERTALPLKIVGVVVLALVLGITWVVTRDRRGPPPRPPAASPAQLGFVAAYLVFLQLQGLDLHGYRSPLSPMFDRIARLCSLVSSNPNLVMNPLLDVVVPALVVVVGMGVRPRDLGLQRGYRTARVTLLWSAVPVALIGWKLVTGTPLGQVARSIVSNTLQNGFSEEFVFRGLVQTRLARFGPVWAIGGASLLFGLSHVPMMLHEGMSLREAVPSTIAVQGVTGLAFGILAYRTRSLIAPSVVHVLVNVLATLL